MPCRSMISSPRPASCAWLRHHAGWPLHPTLNAMGGVLGRSRQASPSPKASGTSPACASKRTKRGVDTVHTLGFGFGCTGLGPGRTGDVFGRVADFQEERLVRVPPRAHVIP
jgi:hypothetical protein